MKLKRSELEKVNIFPRRQTKQRTFSHDYDNLLAAFDPQQPRTSLPSICICFAALGEMERDNYPTMQCIPNYSSRLNCEPSFHVIANTRVCKLTLCWWQFSSPHSFTDECFVHRCRLGLRDKFRCRISCKPFHEAFRAISYVHWDWSAFGLVHQWCYDSAMKSRHQSIADQSFVAFHLHQRRAQQSTEQKRNKIRSWTWRSPLKLWMAIKLDEIKSWNSISDLIALSPRFVTLSANNSPDAKQHFLNNFTLARP